MTAESPIADEYRSLSPLQTRMLTHRRYSEGPNDVDGDVLRALAIRPEQALLDIGCGTGEFLRRLRVEGHTGRLCALDMSAAAVAAASAVDGVDAWLGDAQRLPYAEEEFDAVTARHMLYHVPEPAVAIAEAHRVLRSGGRFAAVVNRVDPLPLMSEVVDGILEGHGYDRAWKTGSRVNAGNLPGMVEDVFGDCQTFAVNGALVFSEPEPIVAYCLSLLTLAGVPRDGEERATIEREIDAEIRRRFAALEDGGGNGVWRDPKGYVVCAGVR